MPFAFMINFAFWNAEIVPFLSKTHIFRKLPTTRAFFWSISKMLPFDFRRKNLEFHRVNLITPFLFKNRITPFFRTKAFFSNTLYMAPFGKESAKQE